MEFMFFFFAMLVSLDDVIRCDIINVKNFCEKYSKDDKETVCSCHVTYAF